MPCFLLFTLLVTGCAAAQAPDETPRARPSRPAAARSVVVYASLDQPFSEPVLKLFEERTGIHVEALYDLEANKTVGLVNRILAERGRPRADVFWNNEPVHTVKLTRLGLLDRFESPERAEIPLTFRDRGQRWYGFGARARVLLVNTELVPEEDSPRSIFDMAHPRWKGKCAMAKPLFGTTATHMAALLASLGPDRTRSFLTALVNNQVRLADGNASVRDMVVRGEVHFGLTDTDDALAPVRKGEPVRIVFPDQADGATGTLLLPNTVAVLKGAPHPEEARDLARFIMSREVEELLAAGPSAQVPVREDGALPPLLAGVASLRTMDVPIDRVADELDPALRLVQEVFFSE